MFVCSATSWNLNSSFNSVYVKCEMLPTDNNGNVLNAYIYVTIILVFKVVGQLHL